MTDIDEPMPHIHEFSDGYYLVNGLFVEPTETTSVRIQDHIYGQLQEQFYGSTGTPILFRHNETNCHFRIEPADSIRSDTIEMPFDIVDQMDIGPVPSEQDFLMPKPSHTETIAEYTRTQTRGQLEE
jgi:hypothetical protein